MSSFSVGVPLSARVVSCAERVSKAHITSLLHVKSLYLYGIGLLLYSGFILTQVYMLLVDLFGDYYTATLSVSSKFLYMVHIDL